MGRSRHSLPFAEQISGAGSPAPLFSLSIPPLPLLFSGICVQTPGLSGEARSPLPLKHCSTVTISGHSGVGWGSMQRAETESALFVCVWGVSQENLGCLRTRLLISSQAKDSNSQVLTGRRGRQGDSVLQKRCPGLGGSKFSERIQEMLSLAHFQFPAPLFHPPSPAPITASSPKQTTWPLIKYRVAGQGNSMGVELVGLSDKPVLVSQEG